MAELHSGRIVEWRRLSPSLSLFRLVAEDGKPFPKYQAGQYIALRRDDCLLTRKVKEGDETRYVPDLDEKGEQNRGTVTHSYSIASAPFESEQRNYLEFSVVLDKDHAAASGRFTQSLFLLLHDHKHQHALLMRIVDVITLHQSPTTPH